MAFHIAQVNIGQPRGPIDGELMREFVANLDPVNSLADGAPGFVWRLQTEDGNATAISVFDDPSLMINMPCGRASSRWPTSSTAAITAT